MESLFGLAMTLLSNMMSRGIDQAMSRSDFSYTHGMTNIPAQVKEMKDAGLNPALAYGQISSPQGQVLGNYQSDMLQGLRDLMSSKQAKAEAEHRDAETRVLNAQAQYIIQKSRAEAGMATFDWAHQGDRYNLEIAGKGLVNAGQRIQNQGYQLDNIGKRTQNEILSIQKDIEEFNRQMKKIDVSKHADFVEAEIQRLLSSALLAGREAWALSQKVPAEVANLYSAAYKFKVEASEMRKNGVYNRKSLHESTVAQELKNEMTMYLRRNGLKGEVLHDTDLNNIVGKIMYSIEDLIGGW